MRKYLLIALMLFLVSPCFADTKATLGGQIAGKYAWLVDEDGNFYPGTDGISDIGTLTKRPSVIYADNLKGGTPISFTAGDFILNTPAPITASTTPGLEIDNGTVAIVWADGETTPIQVSFTVPDGYSTGGKLNVVCGNASGGTNFLAWGVYQNTIGSTWDTSVWNGTPIAVEGSATPDLVTISATPFTSGLTAGEVITVNLWRWDGSVGGVDSGSADLEFYDAYFE